MVASEGCGGRGGEDCHLQGRIAQEAEGVAKVAGADKKNWVCWEISKDLKENRKGSPRNNHPLQTLLNPLFLPTLHCPRSQPSTKFPRKNIRKQRDFLQVRDSKPEKSSTHSRN